MNEIKSGILAVAAVALIVLALIVAGLSKLTGLRVKIRSDYYNNVVRQSMRSMQPVNQGHLVGQVNKLARDNAQQVAGVFQSDRLNLVVEENEEDT